MHNFSLPGPPARRMHWKNWRPIFTDATPEFRGKAPMVNQFSLHFCNVIVRATRPTRIETRLCLRITAIPHC